MRRHCTLTSFICHLPNPLRVIWMWERFGLVMFHVATLLIWFGTIGGKEFVKNKTRKGQKNAAQTLNCVQNTVKLFLFVGILVASVPSLHEIFFFFIFAFFFRSLCPGKLFRFHFVLIDFCFHCSIFGGFFSILKWSLCF